MKKYLFVLTLACLAFIGTIISDAQVIITPSQKVITSPQINGSALFADGSLASPSISFQSDSDTGFRWLSSGSIRYVANGGDVITFSPTSLDVGASTTFRSGSFGTKLAFPTADGIAVIQNNADNRGIRFQVAAVPTIASGFGSSPSIDAGSSDSAGFVNVGTGGAATTGTINFGTTWSVAPYCTVTDSATTGGVSRITSVSTTQIVFTGTAAWTASDKIYWNCIGAK